MAHIRFLFNALADIYNFMQNKEALIQGIMILENNKFEGMLT